MAKAGRPSKVNVRDRSSDTRRALVDAAITTLKTEGFIGASARTIASRAGCNQGLVFYHFGSVTSLLLAALDSVSALRRERYTAAASQITSAADLVTVATAIYKEDLDAGHVRVLAEMIAGAMSDPDLGAEVAARIAPWTEFAQQAMATALGDSPLASLMPTADAAYGIVALYLGLEMLTQLDGNRAPATALFDHAGRLAALLGPALP
jgi:AcrR family transcriptional regulator